MGNVINCFGEKESSSTETNVDSNEEVKKDKKEKKIKEKKPKEKKASKKEKKTNKKDNNNQNGTVKGDKNNKSGSATAKVRPMTPSQAENVPKPVAFEITVDEKTKELTNITITDGNGVELNKDAVVDGKSNDITDSNLDLNGTPRLQSKFPRRLPKLTSLSKTWSSSNEQKTNEEIIQKQKKAEEKRNEILESKKQKARKFVQKFTNKNESKDSSDDSGNNTDSNNNNVNDKESENNVETEINENSVVQE